MREKQREETRRRLYLAALEVFRRDGVGGCRIDDIATMAEVSRAAFYFHFPTKQHVLLELMQEAELPVARALVELPADADIEQVLLTAVQAMVDFWKEDSRLVADVAGVALCHTAQVNDVEAQPVRKELARHFQAAGARGELSPGLPPEALADVFLANALAAMMVWSSGPKRPLSAVLGGIVPLFLNGARAPGKRS